MSIQEIAQILILYCIWKEIYVMFMRKLKIQSEINRLKSFIDSKITDINEFLCAKVPYKNGYLPELNADFKTVNKDMLLIGGSDIHYLVKLSFKTPKSEKNKTVKLRFNDNKEQTCESTVYVNGKMTQSFDKNHRDLYLDFDKDYEILVYTYQGKTTALSFNLLMEDIPTKEIYYDISVPFEALDYLDENSSDYAEILKKLDYAVNTIDSRTKYCETYYDTISKAHKYLYDEFYNSSCGKSDMTVYTVGQTHIDVAWLWPLRVTSEKVQKSFATVVNLMERFDDYTFMCSQPKLYEFIKDQAPELYERIKEKVKEGRFEVEGAMYLEPDCNLISGESFIRQLIYGKKFMKDEFDIDSKTLWLPDTFGYSAALPQILTKCGVTTFATTKISWNEFNKMPYDMFVWKGIDGTGIFTCFFDMLNEDLKTSSIYERCKIYRQKLFSKNTMLAYGFGDGGGGPTEEMLEKNRRLKYGLPGFAKTKNTTTKEFFETAKKDFKQSCEDLRMTPEWSGDLYLEFHRGTYTTISRVKKNNRETEFMLLNTELFSCINKILLNRAYPDLDEIWKTLLLNQFHDIIPGSSIPAVYEDSDKQFDEIKKGLASLTEGNEKAIKENINTKGGILVYNPLGFELNGISYLDGKCIFVENIPPKGYKVTNSVKNTNTIKINGRKISTPFYDVEFDDDYCISVLFDKQNNRQVLSDKGNVLMAYEDVPYSYDPWDICEYYKDKPYDSFKIVSVTEFDNGISKGFKITREFMSSVIEQEIIFYENSRRIDFRTFADWKEEHILLKVLFPVNVLANEATFDIQFGNLKRPTHRNTSWDRAKFEVCAHKWADISEPGYGVALMNDYKFGYSADGNVLGLTLIKSSSWQGLGEHSFTYSILPHSESIENSDIVKESFMLNMPLKSERVSENSGVLPDNYSMISTDKNFVVLDTIKKEENGSNVILRAFETYGSRGVTEIKTGFEFKKAYLCDMLENETEELETGSGTVKVNFKPFEINTIKFIL